MYPSGRATILLGALMLCSACGDKKGDAVADSGAVPAGASTAAMASPDAATAGGLTDANIVYIVSMANKAEIERGNIATTKGTNAGVKDYGKMITGEHTALEAEAQALATKLGVTPAAPAGDQSEASAKAQMDTFNATAKGAAWDKAYVDFEHTYHQQLMETAKSAIAAAKNAELKALLERAAPIVQKHIDHAAELQGKLK
jgi:putative membrane protein